MQCPFAPDFLEASGLASIKGTVAAYAQNATCLGMPGSAFGIPAKKHRTVANGHFRFVDSGLGEKGFITGISGF
jgi:hypothetical protein